MTLDQALGPVTRAERVVVALDIDGTLVPRGNAPSMAARTALHELAAAGAMVVLATGRQLHDTSSVVAALGLSETWLVASDGAIVSRYVGDAHHLLTTTTFDPRPLAQDLVALDPAITLGTEDLGVGYHVNAPFQQMVDRQHRQLVVDEFPAAVTMFTAASTVLSGAELSSVAAARGLSHTGWDEDGMGWLDVAAPGLSKGTGLAWLMETLPTAGTVTIAAGDFHNDRELLAWADIGIAMGHAPPELKAVADHVTGSANDDGIVDVLRDLLAAMRR